MQKQPNIVLIATFSGIVIATVLTTLLQLGIVPIPFIGSIDPTLQETQIYILHDPLATQVATTTAQIEIETSQSDESEHPGSVEGPLESDTNENSDTDQNEFPPNQTSSTTNFSPSTIQTEPVAKNSEINSKELIQELPVVREKVEIPFSEINTQTRTALVNILCVTQGGGSFNPISGSGVIIDERGVILTNAHIAQYFLLPNYLEQNTITCTIRTGSPAKPMYKVEPLYVSPQWVKANSTNLSISRPVETGEFDFGLLLITGHVNQNTILPETFPFIGTSIDDGQLALGENVLLAAYPAEFLGGTIIQKDLYASSAIATVEELFTFKTTTLDLMSVGGSIVAQQGSSGGAVVNGKGNLVGIIVTSTLGETTGDRELRAITVSHVDRELKNETGFTLKEFLDGNLEEKADHFAATILPELARTLLDVFNN